MNEAAELVYWDGKEIKITQSDIERFWSHVNKDTGDCWRWTAGKSKSGYGKFWVPDKHFRAHRFAWIISNGSIPKCEEGVLLFICHKCDVRDCCNPSHLFIGTPLDNARDMVIKGRSASGDANGSRAKPDKLRRGDNHPMKLRPEVILRGESHGNSKLTESLVIEMRRLYSTGERSKAELRRLFGVGYSQVSRILNRESWAHLP